MRTLSPHWWLFCLLTPAAAVGGLQRGEVDLANIPKLQSHYQPEFSFDTTLDSASWTTQKPGLHVAFASTDKLYLRAEVPGVSEETQLWEQNGWRGERLNAQVLVWSSAAQEQVHFHTSDLVNKQGRMLGRRQVRINLVRYVLSNFPYQATGFSCDVTNDAAYLMPDRLEQFDRFDLPARTVRPVWVSVDIPRDAQPGEYEGTIQVRSVAGEVTLRVKLAVRRPVLPLPRDWAFRLDLWQNPSVSAAYFHVKPWSAEHKTLLKKHLELYAQAGGKYITTYAVYSPWADNSFVPEDAMVGWVKTAAGSWKFDYSIFDQYVQLAMDAGVDKSITIYTPIPWGHRFRYLDERSDSFVYAEWPPQSAQFKAVWNTFLDDLKVHLKRKGWLEKTYLGINENPLDLTLAAVKVIKDNSKDWKITYAGDWHPELSPLLEDYSAIITRQPGLKELQERASRGFTTTFYVCCNPARPNTFVFSTPAEAAYLGWYAAACGYSGFLRWAYDAWPADPMRDARHTLWPAGDCFLVYPNANSSIRFEKLREGIVAYEKLRLLRQWTNRSSNEHAKELMKRLEDHLKKFTAERDYPKLTYDTAHTGAMLEQGRGLIDALSQVLDPASPH